MSYIPTLDLAEIEMVENASQNPIWMEAAEKMRDGLGAAGFMYLVNHGISEKVIAQAFDYTKRFYDLPLEKKLLYRKDISNKDQLFDFFENYTGYTPLGLEVLNPKDRLEHKEVFDWTDVAKDKYFPDPIVPGFKENLFRLDGECKNLLKKLMKLMALALKLDESIFIDSNKYFDDPVKHRGLHVGRLNYYPPISDESNATRCAEHTDYTFLTLLFQDSVGGLQVKNAEGVWVNADVVPGSIILNCGDLAEFWTGGVFPAIQHRVYIPPDNVKDDRRKQCRYSIVIFNGLDNATMVSPMDIEKRPKEQSRLERDGKVFSNKPIGAYEYVMQRCANHSY